MKKKIYLFAFVIFGSALFSSNLTNADTAPGDCDKVYTNKKKQFWVSGCKPKEGYECLLRCAHPEYPDLPSISL